MLQHVHFKFWVGVKVEAGIILKRFYFRPKLERLIVMTKLVLYQKKRCVSFLERRKQYDKNRKNCKVCIVLLKQDYPKKAVDTTLNVYLHGLITHAKAERK